MMTVFKFCIRIVIEFFPLSIIFFFRRLTGLVIFKNFVKRNSKNSKNHNNLFHFYDYINSFSQSYIYLEFGVYKGASIRYFSNINTDHKSLFYGFDCFHGLPDNWVITSGKLIPKGTFDVGGVLPLIEDKRVHFIKGYFQNTLSHFIESNSDNLKKNKLVIHFDADLYSSELYSLTQIFKVLKVGDIIFFDDFSVVEHDFRALMDFSESHYVELEMIANTTNFSHAAFKIIKLGI